MYGIIPDFAKKILHANPCYMDKTAIKRLTEKIYPGGDYNEVKSIHISKIIDLMPEDKENVNKIFTDVSLTEDETKQILDTIEEFR